MLTPIAADDADGALAQNPDASPELRRMIRRMARLFTLQAPEAPGLALAGAVLALTANEQAAAGIPALSVTGNGLTMTEALTSCFGETADSLSQFERAGDLVGSRRAPQLLTGWIAQAAEGASGIDWILGWEPGGDAVLVPADICVRRPPGHRAFSPAGALSSGCAAGPTLAQATERAVLELIERDAAALWWLGGRQGAAVPPSAAIEQLLARLRHDRTGRHVILLDITTDIAVPVVAACSHDRDGRFLACGVACRATLAAATKAAILEMAQMELSAPIASQKAAEQGEAALNEADRRHIVRAAMDVSGLHMLVPCAQANTVLAETGPAARLASLGQRLAWVDLTRPEIAVPVVRAIAPGLQPFDDKASTPRLAATVAKTGGGAAHHNGVMPF